MWDKLCYCLERSETEVLLKLVNHIFSILNAFQYTLDSQTDPAPIVKRLDFEPLVTEIVSRLGGMVGDMSEHVKERKEGIGCFAEDNEFREQMGNKISTTVHPLIVLSQLSVHLVRLLTPEFIFENLKQGSELSSNGLQFMQSYLQALYCIEVVKLT